MTFPKMPAVFIHSTYSKPLMNRTKHLEIWVSKYICLKYDSEKSLDIDRG